MASAPNMRRIIRAQRLLAELGHSDVGEALQELVDLRARADALAGGPGARTSATRTTTSTKPAPADLLASMVKAVEALKAQHGRPPEPLRVHPADMDAIRQACRPHLLYPAGPNPADLFAGVRLIEDKEAPRLPRKGARDACAHRLAARATAGRRPRAVGLAGTARVLQLLADAGQAVIPRAHARTTRSTARHRAGFTSACRVDFVVRVRKTKVIFSIPFHIMKNAREIADTPARTYNKVNTG